MIRINTCLKWTLLSLLGLTLISCGGGGSSSSNTANNPTIASISGTVTAPGGTVAFNPPTTFLARLMNMFVGEAVATNPSSYAAVSGATVALYLVDASGNPTGSPIGTGTTKSDGTYIINLTQAVPTGANYVIQVVGSSGVMNAPVTGSTVDVNPITDATQTLMVNASSSNGATLGSIPVNNIVALIPEVQSMAYSTTYAGASTSTASTSKAALVTASRADEETANIASSIGSSCQINGNVKDSSGNALANITMEVMDFPNWVVRAKSLTDTSGNYSLSAPCGKPYILGAINETSASTAASQWWTAAGGTQYTYGADQINLTSGQTVTKNFSLPPGIQISGVVQGGSNNLGGVKVILRDFYSTEPIAKVRTDVNGNYRMSVMPGKYVLSALNLTNSPYGTAYWQDSTHVTASANFAGAVQLSSGQSPQVYNFSLPTGVQLMGKITDPSNPNTGLTGLVVRIYHADPSVNNYGSWVEGIRTDKNGNYNIWLVPKSSTSPTPFYIAQARGQTALINASPTVSTSTTQNFTAQVATIRGFVKDANGSPVSQAKVYAYSPNTPITLTSVPYNSPATAQSSNSGAASYTAVGLNCSSAGVSATLGSSTNNPCFLDMQVSNSDGSFEVYSSNATTVKLLGKIDSAQQLGSAFYSATNASPTQISLADPLTVSLGSVFNLPSGSAIVLKPGVVLTGKVVDANGNPMPNFGMQLRGYSSNTAVDANFSCTYVTSTTSCATATSANASYAGHMYETISTKSDGTFSVSVAPGSYYARISNGYSSYFYSGTSNPWTWVVNGGTALGFNTGIQPLVVNASTANLGTLQTPFTAATE